MARIELNHGYYAEIDDEDIDLVVNHRWELSRGPIKYAFSRRTAWGVRSYTLLHRLIMQPPAGMDVDHIDNNGLNNRRSNLRVCTRSENLSNRRNQINEGVCQRKEGVWRAYIRLNGKQYGCGIYKSKEEALLARRYAHHKIFGEFSKLTSEDVAEFDHDRLPKIIRELISQREIKK